MVSQLTRLKKELLEKKIAFFGLAKEQNVFIIIVFKESIFFYLANLQDKKNGLLSGEFTKPKKDFLKKTIFFWDLQIKEFIIIIIFKESIFRNQNWLNNFKIKEPVIRTNVGWLYGKTRLCILIIAKYGFFELHDIWFYT